ncbi:MAG: cysteine hydrolase family protein [Actinomycetota bacterium]
MPEPPRPAGDGPVAGDRGLAVVDLQRVVGPGAPWEVPGVEAILSPVAALLEAFGPASVLTRHRLAPDGRGRWRAFAERWAGLEADPALWELLEPVAAAVPTGADVVDKTVYGAYGLAELQARLGDPATSELVVAGCETDCCVAATLYAAVDDGVAVTLVTDALVGPDPQGHAGLLAGAARLPEQVRLATAEEAIAVPFARG